VAHVMSLPHKPLQILSEEDPLSLDSVSYWKLHVRQYPVLSKLAINIQEQLSQFELS
jgi:hypothetical protein